MYNIIDDLRYEKEGMFSKIFGRMKGKDEKKVYDQDLPELSKTIVAASPSNMLKQDPMQPKEQKSLPALPSLPGAGMARNIERISEDLDSMKRMEQKVDISRVQPTANERVVYMQAPPAMQSSSQSEVPASQVLVNRSEPQAQANASRISEAEMIIEAGKEKSFFSSIASHVDKEGELLGRSYLRSDIMTKNLVAEMKSHWQVKKEEIKLGIKNQELKDKIFEKIDELKGLEIEWQEKEVMLEELRKQLDFTEKMIEEKGLELKKAVRAAKYSETAKNPFFFRNGKAVRSISELLDVLRILDGPTFNEHVNEMKNDFAHWISAEFKDEALSARVKDAYSRDDLIAILEMF